MISPTVVPNIASSVVAFVTIISNIRSFVASIYVSEVPPVAVGSNVRSLVASIPVSEVSPAVVPDIAFITKRPPVSVRSSVAEISAVSSPSDVRSSSSNDYSFGESLFAAGKLVYSPHDLKEVSEGCLGKTVGAGGAVGLEGLANE